MLIYDAESATRGKKEKMPSESLIREGSEAFFIRKRKNYLDDRDGNGFSSVLREFR